MLLNSSRILELSNIAVNLHKKICLCQVCYDKIDMSYHYDVRRTREMFASTRGLSQWQDDFHSIINKQYACYIKKNWLFPKKNYTYRIPLTIGVSYEDKII